MSNGSTDLVQQRRKKLADIKALGYDPYPHRFEFSHSIDRLVAEFSEKMTLVRWGLHSAPLPLPLQ